MCILEGSGDFLTLFWVLLLVYSVCCFEVVESLQSLLQRNTCQVEEKMGGIETNVSFILTKKSAEQKIIELKKVIYCELFFFLCVI